MRARVRNLFQVLGVRIAEMPGFRNNDIQVTEVVYLVAQGLQPFVQIRVTQRRGAHIYPATVRAQIHRHTNDRNLGHTSIVRLSTWRNSYGVRRYSIRGKGMVSRTCSSPQIQVTARSIPMPKPACGTDPNFLKSRYHSKASRGKSCSFIRWASRS